MEISGIPGNAACNSLVFPNSFGSRPRILPILLQYSKKGLGHDPLKQLDYQLLTESSVDIALEQSESEAPSNFLLVMIAASSY
jgi:hypothetical protein